MLFCVSQEPGVQKIDGEKLSYDGRDEPRLLVESLAEAGPRRAIWLSKDSVSQFEPFLCLANNNLQKQDCNGRMLLIMADFGSISACIYAIDIMCKYVSFIHIPM